MLDAAAFCVIPLSSRAMRPLGLPARTGGGGFWCAACFEEGETGGMQLENQEARGCRRCLLRDLPQAEYFERLHAYIENLDAELKVDSGVYGQRLGRCRECDELISGMCRICGCYVELRAVMKKNICPKSRPEWLPQEAEELYY